MRRVKSKPQLSLEPDRYVVPQDLPTAHHVARYVRQWKQSRNQANRAARAFDEALCIWSSIKVDAEAELGASSYGAFCHLAGLPNRKRNCNPPSSTRNALQYLEKWRLARNQAIQAMEQLNKAMIAWQDVCWKAHTTMPDSEYASFCCLVGAAFDPVPECQYEVKPPIS